MDERKRTRRKRAVVALPNWAEDSALARVGK